MYCMQHPFDCLFYLLALHNLCMAFLGAFFLWLSIVLCIVVMGFYTCLVCRRLQLVVLHLHFFYCDHDILFFLQNNDIVLSPVVIVLHWWVGSWVTSPLATSTCLLDFLSMGRFNCFLSSSLMFQECHNGYVAFVEFLDVCLTYFVRHF